MHHTMPEVVHLKLSQTLQFPLFFVAFAGKQKWCTFGRKLACRGFFLKPCSKDTQIIGIISPSKMHDMTKDAFYTWVVTFRILDAEEVYF